MKGSFDPQLFNKLAFQPESGLMDRKSKLYVVRGNEKKKADLVKDVIALANTARRRGETAYLLLGVRDKPLSDSPASDDGYVGPYPGIKGQSIRDPEPEGWKRKSLEEQQSDVERQYHLVIKEYVTPLLDFEYRYGYVEGRLVSCIVIRYDPQEEPFEVKKQIEDSEKVHCKVGDCWQRIGESNDFVSPEEKPFLYRYSDVPYIKQEDWIRHVRESMNSYPKPDLQISLTLTGMTGRVDNGWSSYWLQDLQGKDPRVALVIGSAGAGKTTKLRELTHQLFSNLSVNLEAILPEEQPDMPIPIYIDLSGRSFTSEDSFKNELVAQLDKFSELKLRSHPDPFSLFQKSGHSFIVLLDGISEVDSTNAPQTRAVVRNLIESSPPRLRFLVGGRTPSIPLSWTEWYPVIRVQPLDLNPVSDFLVATLNTSTQALKFIKSDELLLQLIDSPLTLRAFQETWEQWEQEQEEYLREKIESVETVGPPPQLSLVSVVQEIVNEMMYHDLTKGYIDTRSTSYERVSKLGTLALHMKVKDSESITISQAKESLGKEGFDHCISLGLIVSATGEVGFANQLLLDYFAAYRLRELLEIGASFEALTWERCGEMLRALIVDLLPRLIDRYAKSQQDSF